MSSNVLMAIAQAQAKEFQDGMTKNAWTYFEYGVKLVLARWTALRMAMEGQWGGGDVERKYEILLDEILNVYKYNKVVHTDAMVDNISEYVETEFGLVCEDGSIEEIAELLTTLAQECKQGQYERVQALHEHIQSLIPIDLKKAKQRTEEMMETNEMLPSEQEQVPMVDEDGFTTVRRSTRRKAAPKMYDPAAEFPGSM